MGRASKAMFGAYTVFSRYCRETLVPSLEETPRVIKVKGLGIRQF